MVFKSLIREKDKIKKSNVFFKDCKTVKGSLHWLRVELDLLYSFCIRCDPSYSLLFFNSYL